MTCGANAAVCLLPIALCLLVWGVKRPAALYAGTLVMALMAYTQDMYFFISPAVILLAGIVAAAYGQKKWHALGAALLGLVVCVPALLTLWVNMTGREGFVILDLLEIPKLENFDKADWLLGGLGENGVVWKTVFNQAWAVIVGGIFQVLWHDNISMSLLAPDGFGALYFISVPLILLGLLALLCRRLEGKRAGGEVRAARTMVLGAGVIAFVMLILFGSEGIQNVNGCTSVYDYSALFLYSVLLMVAGLCRIERRSAAGTCAMGVFVCASFAALCAFAVSGSYQMQANVYFVDFAQAAVRAQELGAQNGVKVNVTTSVYPHIQPSAAAEMMYLAATDADMTAVEGQRGTSYELIYARNMVPDPSQVYMVTYEDSIDWDLSLFTYEEIGEYQLLGPKLEP